MEAHGHEKLSRSRRGEPRRAELEAPLERGAARGAKPPSGSWSGAAPARPGDTARRYSVGEKKALIAAYAVAEAAGETMDAFARRHGVSTASLCKWRKALRTRGEAGLDPKPNRRNARGPHRGMHSYTPEQRRAAVEAFLVAGQTVEDFARLWGVSRAALSVWVRAYRRDGPKALEPKRRAARGAARDRAGETSSAESDASTRPDEQVGRRLAAPVRALIARTRDRFAHFGLKKIRDYLLRFHGVKVSPGGVRSALLAEGRVAAQPKRKKVRRAPPAVRSFERAKPMQLWQTDITSFLFGPHKERAYLTVFLDDMSRFIVSFALHLQQKSELVIEALKDGIARFGKPREILSDQGRQYFSWRGQSEFQRLLKREGIQHVVARSHHPQTVGKCERLWETVKVELLDRVLLADLNDARTRVAHYVAHYNFFRPHQGIAGLVPADRFFGAQQALRETLEKQLSQQELALALNESPRAAVFLFGQIGEEKVALHGERGRLVIQTEEGGRRELALHDLGANASASVAPPKSLSPPPAMPPSPSPEEPARAAALAHPTAGESRVATDAQSKSKVPADGGPRDAAHVDVRADCGVVDPAGADRVAAADADADRDGAGRDAADRRDGDGDADDDVHAADVRVDSRPGCERSSSEAPPPRREAGEVSASAAAAGAGALAVGGGERGGEAAGAPELLGDARVLAGEDREDGGGGAALGQRAQSLAAFPASAGGDGGGALEAAADAGAADPDSGSGGGPGDTAASDRAPAAGGRVGDEARRALKGPAGASGERDDSCEREHEHEHEPERGEAPADSARGTRRIGDAGEGSAWPTRKSFGAES